MLLIYNRDPTTTAAYLEVALRRLARVTTAGDGQEVQLPRHEATSIPDLLERLAQPFDLVLEVEGENVDTHGHEHVKTPCAWWAIDSHLHMSYDQHFFRAKRFDHLFVAQKHHVQRYQDWSWVPASWLPLAADPNVFQPVTSPQDFDIGFVGSVLPGLHEARRRLLARMLQRFDRVLVVRGAFREQAARELSRCRVVFNRSLHEDVNMRVFESLAVGRPLLTDRLDQRCGLEELARDGEQLITYEDATFEATAERLLADEDLAEQIASAGRARVLEAHTYEHRAAELLRTLGLGAPEKPVSDGCEEGGA
ncbi:MAG: glycosyltransferase [Planctomycetota bacterium]|nr:glycosyltransferase [Planctomycetota bacterium]